MAGGWNQSLLNCCGDCGVCLCGTCCECCLVYRNAEDLNKPGLLCCILGCFFPCVPALLLRGEARERYNIEVKCQIIILEVNLALSQGSTCGDVTASFCCPLCVQCQVGSEIKERQPKTGE